MPLRPRPDAPAETPPGRRITRRAAWLVLLGWLIVIGALTSLAPTLDSVKTTGDNGGPADAMSTRAAAVAAEHLGADGAPPAIVVVRSGSAETTTEAVARLRSSVEAADLPAVTGVATAAELPPQAKGGGLVSEDGTAQLVLVSTTGAPSSGPFEQSIDTLRTLAADEAGGGVETAVTGPAGIVVDAVKVFGGSDRTLLLGTVALVVVLLFAIYRSPVLVAVALVGVGFAMRLAEGVGALLADAGIIAISGQTASIMTVLLFGVGTDYALIIFARYREALADARVQGDTGAAAWRAMRSVAGALLASVSTIVAAVLALLASVTPVLHDFGPYLAVGVASMCAVAFTLTPALLVLAGRFVLWPRALPGAGADGEAATVPAAADTGSRIWQRVADVVIGAPRRVLVATSVALLVMSGGLVGAGETFDMLSGFRVETDSARGQEMVAESFGPGTIAPSQVVVQAGEPMTERQVGAVVAGLGEVDGVEQARNPQLSEDRAVLGVDVVLTDNPYGPEAMDRVPVLATAAEDAAASAGVADAEALVGGESAVAADTRDALDRDLVVVGLLMILAVTLVLGGVLRSVLAPLYLGLTVVLSYVATMGATAFVTITLGGDLGIGNRVAVYVLVFLVALGVDYTIFLMTRYRQELRERHPVDALRVAVVRTGGVISSAGLILAGTFAVLMTQPIRELYQFGLAMAIGILLDTFVVRPLLVPALIRLLGRNALWPSTVRGAERRS